MILDRKYFADNDWADRITWEMIEEDDSKSLKDIKEKSQAGRKEYLISEFRTFPNSAEPLS